MQNDEWERPFMILLASCGTHYGVLPSDRAALVIPVFTAVVKPGIP
jgi:hypothetical protein